MASISAHLSAASLVHPPPSPLPSSALPLTLPPPEAPMTGDPAKANPVPDRPRSAAQVLTQPSALSSRSLPSPGRQAAARTAAAGGPEGHPPEVLPWLGAAVNIDEVPLYPPIISLLVLVQLPSATVDHW